jgi:hypothetical protein
MNKTPIPTVLKTMQSTFQSAHQIARTGFGEGTNEHVSSPIRPRLLLLSIHKASDNTINRTELDLGHTCPSLGMG